MGSYSGTSEIVEAREDLDSVQYSSKGAYPNRCYSGLSLGGIDGRRKPPALKLGDKDSLEDEINQLFEAISLKNASKGLGVSAQPGTSSSSSPLNRNAMMKRPMVSSVSNSPRVSSSEGVSLKQALRDLCLSKASEMAAMKRVSKSSTAAAAGAASPGGGLEAGRIKSLYNSVLVESKKAGEVARDVGKGKTMVEICLVPEESSGSKKKMLQLEIPKMRSLNPSAQSSPRLQALKSPANLSAQCSPRFIVPPMKLVQSEVQLESKKGGSQSISSSPRLAEQKKVQTGSSATRKVGSQAPESAHSSPRLPPSITKGSNKTNSSNNGTVTSVPKPVGAQAMKTEKIQKEKRVMTIADSISCPDSPENSPKAAAVKPPASTKSTRKASPPKTGRKGSTRNVKHVKTVIRSKNSNTKKRKQGANSASSVSNGGNCSSVPAQAPMVCQKCQCALSSNANEEQPVQQNSAPPISAEITSNTKQNPVEKTKKSSKREKGEFSQSSKSSLGDYSTSTSNSDESNASRFSTCCNRPHMSKDVRWQAVRHVKTRDKMLTLAHFNLLKKLGCGDIGTVYLAELIGTNCLFAIKVMDNEFLARRKKLPRAQTEREILRMLDHPFLPTLYAQFTSDNLSCLVMEFCPGGDLHVLRQKQLGRCFPEPAARFYVAEVLLALEYLHMLGVVYRDLKPENILVREDGHIMLTDFDLSLRCNVSPTLLQSSSPSTATVTDPPRISGPCTSSSCIDPFCIEPSCRVVSCFTPRLLPPRNAAKAKLKAELLLRSSLPQLVAEPTDARSNSFVGTHEYLAPEIIKGDGHGAAVDWWTFGVFLYELLYGRTPFKGAGNDETLANVVLQGLRFPDSPLVSFHARDLIRRLLVKEPEGRLGTEKGAAEIKQHPFFEGLNWALIRCAVPPELPENWYDQSGAGSCEGGGGGDEYLECRATGEHLEFELF